MSDSKEYTAFSIPQREETPAAETMVSTQTGVTTTISFAVPNFAEIEIDSTADRAAPDETAARFFTSVPSAQPIEHKPVDPIRQKFYDMRSLASVRPFSRDDSELFYRQAKFMEDFSDDFEGNAPFNMYYPYYQHMGYENLRTYFTWRTKVRSGEIRQTSLSYIFLYIYELLSGIGVEDPQDGLGKLLALWESLSKENPAIEKYLPKWLKDYNVYYELPFSFPEFIEKHNMQRYYSLTLLFDDNAEDRLELWNSISGYDITNSKFYKEGNEQLMSGCFDAVLSAIRGFCEKRNTRFEDLLIYSVSRRMIWQPFNQALFYSKKRQNDREVHISAFERYYCKNSQWTANLPVYYSSQKDFVGYVIKKTESCLRQVVKYKYKLVADIRAGNKPFRELQRPAAKRAELDKVIEKAVEDFHRDLNRTVVTVDHSNLARIREEALGTQEQLIVPEEDIQSPLVQEVEEDIELKTSEPDIVYEESPWSALKDALTEIELKALVVALDSSKCTKDFADKNGIMLEVLADGINEKAADYIGDNILEVEDDIMIYDDYRDNIVEMIGEA